MIICAFTPAQAEMLLWLTNQFMVSVDPKRHDAPPSVQDIWNLVGIINADIRRASETQPN